MRYFCQLFILLLITACGGGGSEYNPKTGNYLLTQFTDDYIYDSISYNNSDFWQMKTVGKGTLSITITPDGNYDIDCGLTSEIGPSVFYQNSFIFDDNYNEISNNSYIDECVLFAEFENDREFFLFVDLADYSQTEISYTVNYVFTPSFEEHNDSIYLYGIHNDVEITEIEQLGFVQCYSGSYGESLAVSELFSACGSDELIIGAAQAGSSRLDIFAFGNYNDITKITAINETILADNGVRWYFNNQSMGFAGADDDIYQYSADINGTTYEWGQPVQGNENDRLSWHTYEYANEIFVNSGWRSGLNTDIYDGWSRYVFYRN